MRRKMRQEQRKMWLMRRKIRQEQRKIRQVKRNRSGTADGRDDAIFGRPAEEWYEISMPAAWEEESGLVYEEKNDF